MEQKTFIDEYGYSNFSLGKRNISSTLSLGRGYMARKLAEKKAGQMNEGTPIMNQGGLFSNIRIPRNKVANDYATANQQQFEATNYLQQQMGQGTPIMSQGTPLSMDLEQGRTLDLGEITNVDSGLIKVDPQFVINNAVGVLAEENKPELVKLLQNQGSLVSSLSSKKDIIDASFQLIRDNEIFRKKLSDYIVEEATNPKPKRENVGALVRLAQGSILSGRSGRKPYQPISSNFSSFSDFDDNFANKDGEGREKAKKLFGSLASEQNLQNIVGIGMSYLSTRMNANAQKGTNQQAIEFEKAQTEKALAQAKLLEMQGKTPTGTTPSTTTDDKGKKKWVMPVAIGGGVLLLGTIIYFAMRKKN